MLRNARTSISRSGYLEAFKQGVQSLPRLSKLTYEREWPDDGALNIMQLELQGPYPEPLHSDDVSLEDDWSGLRNVLETLKEVNISGRRISLELRTPMAS